MARSHRTPRPLLYSRDQIPAGSLQRRNQPDQQPNERGNANCERKYSAIDGDGAQARQARRTERHQRFHAGLCDQHPQRAAQGGQQQAFGEQLPDQARACCAQRGAHGEFAAPLRAARE